MPLLKGELKELLKVKTSVKEAKRIKKRNEWALYWLLSWVEDPRKIFAKERIGCPHCRPDFCWNCRWRAHEAMECMHANFCGLCLMDVDDIIDYTKHTVAVSLSNESTKEDVESAIAFVRGHIQWANAVIKKGS